MQKRTQMPVQAGMFVPEIIGGGQHSRENPAAGNRGNSAGKKTKPRENLARISRENFPEDRENEPVLTAVWPYITNEALSITMDSYRVYISRYNERIRLANSDTAKYNAEVQKYRSGTELTEVQKEYSRIFCMKNAGKRAAEFNQLADQFNQEYGMLVRKRNLATVKYATELVFKQIMHIYSTQLSKQTAAYMQLGTCLPKPIKKLEINAWHITELKRNEVASIDICIQTVRNHRERLEEAGVLIDYSFRGHEKGVRMAVNPQILSIYDAKTQKLACAGNQQLNPETLKDFVDKQIVYKTIERNIKKKENGRAASPGKGTPAAGLSFVFYKNIPGQCPKSDAPAAAENVKVLTLSERLWKNLMPDQELALQLSSGYYNAYTPIDIRHFHREAYDGTLTREEFKEVVIQEFFKSAAKLYRNTTPYPGSWKKAINSWMEKQFTFRNGNETGTYSKSLIADKLAEFRWRINHAHKWFLKSGVKTLYPSDYFDFTRQNPKEIGFEYTKKAWKNHLKYLESNPEQKKKIAKKAVQRLTQINHSKKFEAHLNRFLKNKISVEDLFDKIALLPPQYSAKLSETLLKISASKTMYSLYDVPSGEC